MLEVLHKSGQPADSNNIYLLPARDASVNVIETFSNHMTPALIIVTIYPKYFKRTITIAQVIGLTNNATSLGALSRSNQTYAARFLQSKQYEASCNERDNF